VSKQQRVAKAILKTAKLRNQKPETRNWKMKQEIQNFATSILVFHHSNIKVGMLIQSDHSRFYRAIGSDSET